ncbi:hypothetical protein [Altererythrobacter lutimaris]|uniref:Uncharacterized protein n=1 Tax=Altererythrobacter lutimaris TaxID=2743979 RepID=A0A850HE31_9SPHN|nr:hypothetical protein [Altererythrobacter lutimaris]NVE95391.1 hypothetical protein [Altererythrobacter lutimaris]
MSQDNFLPRCHPHMLGEEGKVDLEKCEALSADMAELREMGVILTLVASYKVGTNRYTNLGDALAQARIQRSMTIFDQAANIPSIKGH